jgi:hypothetical protein
MGGDAGPASAREAGAAQAAAQGARNGSLHARRQPPLFAAGSIRRTRRRGLIPQARAP